VQAFVGRGGQLAPPFTAMLAKPWISSETRPLTLLPPFFSKNLLGTCKIAIISPLRRPCGMAAPRWAPDELSGTNLGPRLRPFLVDEPPLQDVSLLDQHVLVIGMLAPGAIRSRTVSRPCGLSRNNVLLSTPGNWVFSQGSSRVHTKRDANGPRPAWFFAFGVTPVVIDVPRRESDCRGQSALDGIKPPAQITRFNPNVAEVYRQKAAHLEEALNDPALREDAAEILRGLVDEIRLAPVDDGALQVELFGELAAIVTLGENAKANRAVDTTARFSLVAGRGFEPLTFRL
jgi:hypothetical protein